MPPPGARSTRRCSGGIWKAGIWALERSLCPLPNPPPLRRGGDCRRFAEGTLSREAGEGRGGGKGAPKHVR
ncbi:hypothetical protein Sp245p_06620 [Azospirillum baldaniorum]|uniref:Uncharacterized protein n=1 Tax=Azospirillum baldaniorum TaxID=1064539 RepID=A0A9P1JS04_9PROT|nr:hypothetical protein Sp245p_06620 [Azospirillum baldaniorum]CCC98632.1 protein of unknown function [Azospirillum baldaniorum]